MESNSAGFALRGERPPSKFKPQNPCNSHIGWILQLSYSQYSGAAKGHSNTAGANAAKSLCREHGNEAMGQEQRIQMPRAAGTARKRLADYRT